MKKILREWKHYLNESQDTLLQDDRYRNFLEDLTRLHAYLRKGEDFKFISNLNYDRPKYFMDKEEYGPHVLNFSRVVRGIKKLWNKHCDREFIQSLTKTHSIASDEELEQTLRKIEKKSEISVSLTLPNVPVEKMFSLYTISLLVDGWVSFAGNSMDVVYSGNLAKGLDDSPRSLAQRKESGIPRYPIKIGNFDGDEFVRHLIFDRSTFVEGRKGYRAGNEGYVKNPRARAIIINTDNLKAWVVNWNNVVLLAEQYKLPLLNCSYQPIRYVAPEDPDKDGEFEVI